MCGSQSIATIISFVRLCRLDEFLRLLMVSAAVAECVAAVAAALHHHAQSHQAKIQTGQSLYVCVYVYVCALSLMKKLKTQRETLIAIQSASMSENWSANSGCSFQIHHFLQYAKGLFFWRQL